MKIAGINEKVYEALVEQSEIESNKILTQSEKALKYLYLKSIGMIKGEYDFGEQI